MTNRRRATLALALLATAAAPTHAQAPAVCPVTPGADVALVLSGGSAKGIAHIGVLRVLDSLGIRPTTVVGTSMGALVGAMYANGRSGREIDSLVRRLPLESLFGPYLPSVTLTAGDLSVPAGMRSPTFVIEERGGSFSLRSPLAREAQLNTLLNRLLLGANLRAAGDFDSLPLRYRAVATDLQSDQPVVLAEGDLAEAVRASIAIPLVFSPVTREGRVLIDGGLSANVPVQAARAITASPLVVSDVGEFLIDSTVSPSTATLVAYLIEELFTQTLEPPGARDVRIEPETQRFLPFDFSRPTVDALIARGYEAAAKTLAACAPAPPRAAVADTSSRFAVDQQFIAGRLARVVSEGEFESVWLRPRPAAGDSLAFAPIARPAPRRVILGGITYDARLGAELWVESARNAVAGGHVRAGGALLAGESRQQVTLGFTSARRVGTPIPSHLPGDADVLLADPRLDVAPWSEVVLRLVRPELTVSGSREIVRLHDARDRERARTSTRDATAFLGAVGKPTPTWQLAFGTVGHVWRLDRGALVDPSTHAAWGGVVRAARIVTSDAVTPIVVEPSIVAAEGLWLDRYWRVGGEWNRHSPVGRLVLRQRAAAGWGESLPVSRLLVLGGSHGFPGLHRNSWRATRTASATVGLLRRITGPVAAYAEVGGGWSSLAVAADPLLVEDAGRGSVAGAEIGVTATTPLGAAVIGYGRTTRGSSVLRVQLGR